MSHRAIIVCGNAGVGKTTYAAGLAKNLHAVLLDIDTVSERLVRAGLIASGRDPNDRDSPSYKRDFRLPIHETLFAIAKDNLQHQSCIIVAPFTQERRDPRFLDQLQQRLGVPAFVHYLVCAEETRKARIISRNNPRDASKLSDWDNYSASGRDPGPPPFAHLLVRTD